MLANGSEDVYAAPLFSGLSAGETDGLLAHFSADIERFEKGDVICSASTRQGRFCCLLRGSALAYQYDYWGNRSIITHITCGSMVSAPDVPPLRRASPDVQAAEASAALFLKSDAFSRDVPARLSRAFGRFTANMLGLLLESNRALLEKNYILEQRSIRGKVMAYLSYEALKNGSPSFTVPLSRQEMADYLYVDRCALSHELTRMREDGMLSYRRGRFTLLAPPAGSEDGGQAKA